ncbi:MAG TPA: YceI family protein [Solimonas sp.]|nr:YceI family protein [Solimonas sp.]
MLIAFGLLFGTAMVHAAPRPLIADKSRITFSVKEMGVSVSGRFSRFDAAIDLDPAKPETSSATLSVDIASLTTGNADADTIALDAPWLDQRAFPKATFVSSAVERSGDDRYTVRGTLTIRGKARAIVVPLTAAAQTDRGLVVRGGFTIRRSDFAIGGGEWNESGVVADEVPVSFELTLGAPH